MEIVSKVLISLAGAAGVSSAVGLPLLSLRNREESSESNEIISGGGRSALVSLDMCTENGVEDSSSIKFGDQDSKKICGKIKSGEQGVKSSNEYSEFFKTRGGKNNQDGNSNLNQDKGTKQCYLQDQLKGAVLVSNSGNGSQHLGLCVETEAKDTKFVKKVQKPVVSNVIGEPDGTGWVCEQNCGETESGLLSSSATTLQTEKSGAGKEIQFYKNS